MAAISTNDLLTKDFFEILGLEDLSEEQKTAFAKQISETVMARVYLAMHDELSEEQRVEMDNKSPEVIIQWLNDMGFDVQKLYVDEMIKYRLELAVAFDAVSHSIPPAAQPAAA